MDSIGFSRKIRNLGDVDLLLMKIVDAARELEPLGVSPTATYGLLMAHAGIIKPRQTIDVECYQVGNWEVTT